MNVYRNTFCAIASAIFTLTIVGFSSSSAANTPFVSTAATPTAQL